MSRIFCVRQALAPLCESCADRKENEKGVISNIGDEVLYGSPVIGREENGEWIRVLTFYGYAGWMRRDALQETDSDGLTAYETGDGRVTTAHTVDVLSMPSVRGAVLLSLPGGSLLQAVEDRADGWTAVRLLNGEQGYVPTLFLEKPRFAFEFLHRSAEETEQILRAAAVRGRDTVGGNGFSFRAFLDRQYGGEEESFRRELVRIACTYCGTQYRWAGRSTWGIDCSGMVSSAYLRAGVIIYRDAALADGFPMRRIPDAIGEDGHLRPEALTDGTMRPGDAVYFPGHIGMYLGGGAYLHSTARPGSNGVVKNSFIKNDALFRQDLLDSLYAVGGLRKE